MKRFHLNIFTIILVILAALPLEAGKRKASPITSLSKAERKYHGRISMQLTELGSGRIILSHRADQPMIPASVVKLISTGTFLRQRGAQYRFETKVYALGAIRDSILYGDLVLVGSGDPSLASRYEPESEARLKQTIARILRSSGISTVKGRLLIDGSSLPQQGIHSSWLEEDTGNYYGVGVYGLNYRDNYIDLLVSDAADGEIVVEPTDADFGLSYLNHLYLGGRNNSCYLTDSDTLIRLSGSVPLGCQDYNLRPAHPAPMAYAHRRLRRLLNEEEGILIEQDGAVGNYQKQLEGLAPLGIHTSVPADSLARITNYRSANLYAEVMGRCLSTEGSRDLGLAKYWQDRLQLKPSAITLADGSGLSRDNRLTARALSSILVDLLPKDSVEVSPLLSSLPIMGQEGTVKSFMPGSPIEARLKSGSMRGVTCYAGYVRHRGQWYALVMMANGFGASSQPRAAFASFMNSHFLSKGSTANHTIPKAKGDKKRTSKTHKKRSNRKRG